jgi:predicted RNase H-like HicB family nuclease
MEYVVKYELDEDGWWFTSIPAVQGCHTQGATLPQARDRIRECLGLYVPAEEAQAAKLVDQIDLPERVSAAFREISAYGIHHGVDAEILLESHPA